MELMGRNHGRETDDLIVIETTLSFPPENIFVASFIEVKVLQGLQ